MIRTTTETGQMALGGFEPPQPTDRLFFAVFPDATAAAAIADIAQALRSQQHLQGKPLRSDRFHVTLHHLGDYAGLPQDVVAKAGQAAAAVDMPAFEVAFDSAASFSGHSRHHPFVLRGDDGVVAVRELQRRLGACMATAGLGRLVRPAFTPHVTLLYEERMVAMQTVDRIAWIAREFVLVHSLLGRTEHRVLGRWPLRAANA
ncbi:2'-5' RNA ligase family protein [Luteimonas cucumeris]|nr:2'-5' RNA ligase family protein [Luteimonas cucumeris]